MSKAILVMDMPNICGECALRMAMICTPTMKDIDNVNTKMDWCPLKIVPDKLKDTNSLDEYETGFVDGWNNFIEENFEK